MRQVIDTGVALMATDRGNDQPQCQLASIEALLAVMDSGIVLIDSHYHCLAEYGNKLSDSGQPGVGDKFYLWVLRNRSNPNRVVEVDIHPLGESDKSGYRILPASLSGLDKSDQKFVCVCIEGNGERLLVASDTDWLTWEDDICAEGVPLVLLCRQMLESQRGPNE